MRFSAHVKRKQWSYACSKRMWTHPATEKAIWWHLPQFISSSYQFELWLKVWDMPSQLSLPRQGPRNLVWVKQVFELSEVELTEFHCIQSRSHSSEVIIRCEKEKLSARRGILCSYSGVRGQGFDAEIGLLGLFESAFPGVICWETFRRNCIPR